MYKNVNNVKCQQCQTLVNHILVHMGLNCPTEVQTKFPIFFKTPPCETTVHCCAAALVWCHFCDLYIYCNISLMHCIFGALHHWCYVFAPLVCYALASLVCIIVGALQLWWILFWLQYFCDVMSVHCIFGVMYTKVHICNFGMLCIGNFGGASLVWLLLCNASLVHCSLVLGAIFFWCCIFGAMHCQLYRAGLLPQWHIYFICMRKNVCKLRLSHTGIINHLKSILKEFPSDT